jgi:hypothetical protein
LHKQAADTPEEVVDFELPDEIALIHIQNPEQVDLRRP